MPRYCAAQDCSNSVCYSGRPAHKFPSEPTLRKLWIRAARPSQPTWKPAKGDCLCTEHFEDEDYKTSPKLLQSLGLPVKQAYLKPDVVPSLFTRKRKRERHSGAVEKRRRKEPTIPILLPTLCRNPHLSKEWLPLKEAVADEVRRFAIGDAR
ncbi:hypothetical protein ISCGN_006567 [Ixodes scapularis]